MIAHLCHQCGRDLARHRPHREGHYNLDIITCRCGCVVTRRVHPVWRTWRSAVRLTPVVLALSGQAVATPVLVAVNLFAAASLVRWVEHQQQPLAQTTIDHRVMLIWSLLIVPLITGTWLRSTLNHWRYLSQYLAWYVLVVAVMTMVFIIWPWSREKLYWVGAAELPTETVADLAPLWRASMLTLAVMMVVALAAGATLGRAVVRSHAQRRVLRWRRRRRRWRAKGINA